jgi:hypothetical protein
MSSATGQTHPNPRAGRQTGRLRHAIGLLSISLPHLLIGNAALTPVFSFTTSTCSSRAHDVVPVPRAMAQMLSFKHTCENNATLRVALSPDLLAQLMASHNASRQHPTRFTTKATQSSGSSGTQALQAAKGASGSNQAAAAAGHPKLVHFFTHPPLPRRRAQAPPAPALAE